MKQLFLLFMYFWGITHFAYAQDVTYHYILKPGWNSIYLEVQPTNNSITDILNDLPVISVWKWNNSNSSIELIQDNAGEIAPEQKKWGTYFKNKPSFITDLFTMNGGNCYLIKIDGNNQVPLIISGKPILPKIKWDSDSYNLVGFHFEPGNEPFFKDFFDYSPFHKDQTIYRLTDNKWEIIQDPGTTQMKSGEAFWVYCKGGQSDYVGPLKVVLEQQDELNFGKELLEQTIKINRLTDTSIVSITTTGNLPLKYYVPSKNPGWKEFSNEIIIDNSENKNESLRLSVDRSKMNSQTSYSSVIEVKDDNGMRIQFVAKAEKKDFKGLWIGNVIVNKVDQPGKTYSPTQTDSELQFRIIIHVDKNENVNLLKEVTQMWDQNSNKYILVTNYSKLHNYTGASLRNGELIGRRVSSVVFGFDGIKELDGTFGFHGTLKTKIEIPPGHPTNPYYHKFHPDHNNLDENYENYKQEALNILRTIELQFHNSDPDSPESTSIGLDGSVLGGKYKEILEGLHRDPIQVEGSFRIQKVSSIAQLIN